MPAFCLGCLGCLKCLVPSFVPVLGSLAVTFFMVSWFDYKVLPTSPTLPSKLIKCFFFPTRTCQRQWLPFFWLSSSLFPSFLAYSTRPPRQKQPKCQKHPEHHKGYQRRSPRQRNERIFSSFSLSSSCVALLSLSYEIDLSPCVLQLFGQRAVKWTNLTSSVCDRNTPCSTKTYFLFYHFLLGINGFHDYSSIWCGQLTWTSD